MDHNFIAPIKYSLDILSKKWTVEILYCLMDSPKRFSEISKLIPNASHKMITFRLKELLSLNLITRFVVNILPLKVSYGVTDSVVNVTKLFLELGKFSYILPKNDQNDKITKEIFESFFKS